MSYFSGCDYFRLSTHPQVRQAAVVGLKRFGLNVAASRLTTGNHVLYAQLENALARFFNVPAALLTPTGYVANFAVAQAIKGQFSHILIDELSHPSLQDAALLLDCPVISFQHCSVENVRSILARCGSGCRPILLTDGMFSRDGSVAPLREYQAALPRDSMLLVDDAHGAGVLGKEGRGSIELERTSMRNVIQTITLSKAFGVYGGAILGSESLKKQVMAQSRLFIGSTPLPLPLVWAARKALGIISRDSSLRSRLFTNARHVRDRLSTAGLHLPQMPGPIIALEVIRSSMLAKVKKLLLNAGIYPPFIIYPGGPTAGYFRFVISSEHKRQQLDNLASTLGRSASLLAPVA